MEGSRGGSGSLPAELDQTIVVDAEMMRDFVDDGAGNFPAEFLSIVEVLEQCVAIDDDAVRQNYRIKRTFRQGRAGTICTVSR